MSEDRGACEAALVGVDRGGPPLWQVFGPQQGRVSRKTQKEAR
ncbi:hypothetical protein SacmaDRAFT_4857 [Saccharomonospora marina XMU15]|uniref:Uncharacterized protein n=1 Tax=Saccharomonospora marina XMU15 TaxID=882083 RepID=H5X034_9PSEU|nr:hypothetical protein SacmaDRAFT_4857 [Saccharomonospora marina XMU15]